MYYVGLDIGKKWHYAVVMDEAGHRQGQQRVPNDPLALQQFFERLDGPCRVVLEATGNWIAVYDRVEPYTQETILAHPLKVRACPSPVL